MRLWAKFLLGLVLCCIFVILCVELELCLCLLLFGDDSKWLPFFFFLAILLSSWPAVPAFYRQTQFLLDLWGLFGLLVRDNFPVHPALKPTDLSTNVPKVETFLKQSFLFLKLSTHLPHRTQQTVRYLLVVLNTEGHFLPLFYPSE